MTTLVAPCCACSCSATWSHSFTFPTRWVEEQSSRTLNWDFSLGPLSLGAKRPQELSPGQVPQLATCTQRGPNNVRHAKDRQNGTFHDGPGNTWSARCLFVPRPGPSRHQQRIPDQNRVSPGHTLHNKHNGASSLRSVCDDTQLRGKQYIPSKFVKRK